MIKKIKRFFDKIENIYLFEVPDEDRHYFKAWEVANGQIFCKEEKSNYIPQEALDLPEQMSLLPTEHKKIAKFDFGKVVENLKQETNYNKIETIKTQFCGAAPFGYLATASSLKIGELINLPIIANFYLGRFINLALAIFIIYLSIKITPVGKMVFLTLALLPMTVQELASFSYDSLHISLIFLFIAYLLKLHFEKNKSLGKKDLWILFTLSLVALNIKFGYFPLAGLIFLVPNSKFKNNKTAWIFKIIFSLINILFFLLLYKIFQFPTVWPEGVNVSQQISFVFDHPFYFIKSVLFSTFQNGLLYLQGIIGIPGPFRTSFPLFTYLLVLMGIPFLVTMEKEKLNFSLKENLLTLSIAIINIFLIFFVLYLIWTPVGNSIVLGVQGRYFVVISLLIALLVSQFKIKFELKHKSLYLSLYLIILFFSVFSSILNLYY